MQIEFLWRKYENINLIEVYNTHGQKVVNKILKHESNIEISMNENATEIYLVNTYANDTLITKKLLKK